MDEYYRLTGLETKAIEAKAKFSTILTKAIFATFNDIEDKLYVKRELDKGEAPNAIHFVSVKMKNVAVGGICYTLHDPWIKKEHPQHKQCYFVGIHKLPSFFIWQKIIGHSLMFTSYVDLILTHLKKKMKLHCRYLYVQPIGIMAKKTIKKGI